MALPLLPLSGELSTGLQSQIVGYVGALLSSVTPEGLKATLDTLKQTSSSVSIHLDVTALSSIDDILELLDAGVSKIIISLKQLNELESIKDLDQDRIILMINGPDKDEIVNAIGGKSVGVFSANVKDEELAEAWLNEYGEDRPPVFVSFASPSEEHVLKLASLGGIPVVPVSMLTTDPSADSKYVSLSKIILAGATSDRQDGLFTTLVTDERGTALGLVYSSEKSVEESLRLGRGVYHSRKRGLWYKGDTSGDIQVLIRVSLDCDKDCLRFVVEQKGKGTFLEILWKDLSNFVGFCHLGTATCFGNYGGLSRLQKTLQERKSSAPLGSYTARLFNDPDLLKAKIMEEAGELCEATSKDHISFEAADLLYFALTKCVAAGVSLEDVERNLDAKSLKIKRRKGDSKLPLPTQTTKSSDPPVQESEAIATPGKITMKRYDTSTESSEAIQEALKRPSQRSPEKIMGIVQPIIKDIQEKGDEALLGYTHKFEKATSLTSPVLKAPFPESLMKLSPETIRAIDISYENIRKFHAAQKDDKPLNVETMPGVVCSRFSRPIERVGLYVPGGTAVLPSTALMLGVPAMVAGCKKIVIASPPRADGSITPEIVYIARKVGAESIVLAGGAQAVAAMAYGTESVSKVDKILGPGNQFVTAAKMVVSNDTSAAVAIDMPAGPSEVLVIADQTARPDFVAADLLSQAEHGADSQVVLIAINLTEQQLAAIEQQVDEQANALPRKDIVQKAIEHSVTLLVKDVNEAMRYSNLYAPEHLILQIHEPEKAVPLVQNAGSVFIGPWTPESVGDYSAGVNHSLRTYSFLFCYNLKLILT
jgi:phosphoribosyl-ATP pyrophosphohydrolase / phosphoribosyl-AMP cyclohydrolase / histidinol dehydrogenase